MKVILNVDVDHLGEEGDVKNVAAGYARNFLLPRKLVVPYNAVTAAMFEERKAEIEAKKEIKRQNAQSLKERLEATNIEITMPASPTGKLYGAVTNNVLVEALAKNGFEIERKRIEIQGLAIKAVGNYHAVIKLYEAQTAEISFVVKAEAIENSNEGAKKSDSKKRNAKSEEKAETSEPVAEQKPASNEAESSETTETGENA